MSPSALYPTDLVAVDPGKHMLGLSFWDEEKVLQWAGWVPVQAAPLPKIGLNTRVVMERPRARPPAETPGGTSGYQALVDITFAGALYAGHVGARVETVYPDEWKGGTSKRAVSKGGTELYVVERRVLEILSPAERARIEWPSAKGKRHNVADALGLGLFALGRCGRGVVRKGLAPSKGGGR